MSILLPARVAPETGEQGFTVNPLSVEQLRGLMNYFGQMASSAMPDPQARRYECRQALKAALGDLHRRNWEDLAALVEFEALLEGFCFDILRLRIYDLREMGFLTMASERYLGVLVDRGGEVLGATDPEGMLFRAADLKGENWSQLLADAGRARWQPQGVLARALLSKFRDSFGDLWNPDAILWMRAVDAYMDRHRPGQAPAELTLRSGWKQVGPVLLRDNYDEGRKFSPYYLPVYQEDYLQKARVALAATYVQELQRERMVLKVDGQECGFIWAPRAAGVAGQDPRMLGEGNLEILPNAPMRGQAQLNYDALRRYVQPLLGNIRLQDPGVIDKVTREKPFSYPDIVRIPLLLEGAAAVGNLREQIEGARIWGSTFSAHLAESGLQELPSIPEDLTGARVFEGPDYCYYVELVDGRPIVYVESFRTIKPLELTLVGEALWLLFNGQARLSDQGDRILDRSGATILACGEGRLESRLGLRPSLFDQLVIGRPLASLYQLWAAAHSEDIDALLREAVIRWFRSTNPDLDLPRMPGSFTGSKLPLGRYTWFTASGGTAVIAPRQ